MILHAMQDACTAANAGEASTFELSTGPGTTRE